MAYICEQCKTELKSKPRTYYKKDLHYIKGAGYQCQKKILEE